MTNRRDSALYVLHASASQAKAHDECPNDNVIDVISPTPCTTSSTHSCFCWCCCGLARTCHSRPPQR